MLTMSVFLVGHFSSIFPAPPVTVSYQESVHNNTSTGDATRVSETATTNEGPLLRVSDAPDDNVPEVSRTGDAATSFAGEPVTFSVTGDYPYDRSELDDLERHMEDHNLYSPSDFFVHVGDIMGGNEGCRERYYRDVADLLKTLAVPAFIVDRLFKSRSRPAVVGREFCGFRRAFL
jgi:hypothetical protein